MAINRILWKGVITKQYAPAWPCPACTSHPLKLKRDALHFAETTESRRKQHDEGFEPIDRELTFSAMFECSNCKQSVSCCGDGGFRFLNNVDEDSLVYPDLEEVFTPQYFWPSLVLFSVPRCPKLVKHQLTLSFRTFFCDLNAAANHVRSCIDELLCDRNISRTTRTLHNRIEEFGKADSANAEFAKALMALKWIGNVGSHPGDLTKNDLFDAYDIIELLLEDIYTGHRRRTQNKVAEINKRRRALSA